MGLITVYNNENMNKIDLKKISLVVLYINIEFTLPVIGVIWGLIQLNNKETLSKWIPIYIIATILFSALAIIGIAHILRNIKNLFNHEI